MGDPCYSVCSLTVLQSGSMLPGSESFQMFLSLILILGAAFVALICDHLKRNNDHLRELAIELQVRRQEEHKRFQMLVPPAAKTIEPLIAPPITPRPSAPQVRPPAARTVRMRVSPPKPQELGLPSGFHDGQVLTRLVKQRQPVSGLVVSIGVSGSPGSDVQLLIQSLIGPSDFAAQAGGEEFLLIFPAERGMSAQRRLSQVAQELWDFQLNSRETCSILFSWGGVEVREESIDEAIESANERMQETRRSRKVLTMESRAV
jgi:hypothetical protein